MDVTIESLKEVLSKSSSLGDQINAFNGEESIVDQGVDSLDMLDFFLNLEEKYGIQIPDNDIEQLNSLNDILDYLKKRVNG